MRSKFDEQLEYLNVELIKMGALCEEAISSAIKALLDDDREMSRKAHDTDREIDQKERDIEALCLKLLLQQQPVARDLRVISSALKMISDMERIGDQAADIAEITSFIIGSNAQGRIHLRDMALAAINMVTESIDSFVEKDMALAEHVIQADDVVDALFLKVKTELISLIQNDNGGAETYLDLLMIAKYLERIGDHATNIAEWVLFSITGKHAES
ncbi:MAG: phosphate signaling complex protein PhoU [Clostridiaceae bacterium]|nr:phosphate signaling complex protein PhoU [Clostridiaceae bacterium]